jgi:hypothetical protein
VRYAPLALLVCAACAALPRATETPRPGSPIDAAAAGALEAHELAEGAPKETAYGWKLEIAGERARYFACSTADACTFQKVDVPAASVRATKVVRRTRPTREDGTSVEEVDVYELTLVRDESTTRGGSTWDPRGFVIR